MQNSILILLDVRNCKTFKQIFNTVSNVVKNFLPKYHKSFAISTSFSQEENDKLKNELNYIQGNSVYTFDDYVPKVASLNYDYVVYMDDNLYFTKVINDISNLLDKNPICRLFDAYRSLTKNLNIKVYKNFIIGKCKDIFNKFFVRNYFRFDNKDNCDYLYMDDLNLSKINGES